MLAESHEEFDYFKSCNANNIIQETLDYLIILIKLESNISETWHSKDSVYQDSKVHKENNRDIKISSAGKIIRVLKFYAKTKPEEV